MWSQHACRTPDRSKFACKFTGAVPALWDLLPVSLAKLHNWKNSLVFLTPFLPVHCDTWLVCQVIVCLQVFDPTIWCTDWWNAQQLRSDSAFKWVQFSIYFIWLQLLHLIINEHVPFCYLEETESVNDCWWEQVVRGEEDAHIKRRQVMDTRKTIHSNRWLL